MKHIQLFEEFICESASSNMLLVKIDKSNRYYDDGMRDLSVWYAKEFSEYLFGSKHNIQVEDFVGSDGFILKFTGSGLKGLTADKAKDYASRINKSWSSDGLSVSVSK